jgi:hypothetical protein
MSRQADPFNALDSPDSSGDFGKDEGRFGYSLLASRAPDTTPMAQLAERAIHLSKIVHGRFDVEPRAATQSLIGELTADFPEIEANEGSEGQA